MPRRLLVVLAVLATALGTATPAPAAAKRCGTTDLVINDDPYTKARGIKATGTSCRVAKRVAKAAARAADQGTFAKRYRARRFTCKGVESYGVYYAMHYTCRRGAARIRFRASPA